MQSMNRTRSECVLQFADLKGLKQTDMHSTASGAVTLLYAVRPLAIVNSLSEYGTRLIRIFPNHGPLSMENILPLRKHL